MKNYNKAYKQNKNFKQNNPSFENKKQEPKEIHDGPLIENNTDAEEIKNPTWIGKVSGAQKVYMRFEADKESEPVDIMEENDEVEIIDSTNPEWYKVCNSAGIEGYIMKKFITNQL